MFLYLFIYLYFINKSYFYKCVNSPGSPRSTMAPDTLNIRLFLDNSLRNKLKWTEFLKRSTYMNYNLNRVLDILI